ncbi:MAG: glycine cleavage system protein [Thermoleophilia bacterium]|nr:glycine cleavage system protein [Thermoleophilia bacterium]
MGDDAYPDDRRYSAEHGWVQLEGRVATIGVTDHAQQALGEIVYFAPPDHEQALAAGRSYGELESVKAVSDLVAPLDGVVVEVNDDIVGSPEQVNERPHDAWLVRVEVPNSAQYDQLLDAATYGASLR